MGRAFVKSDFIEYRLLSPSLLAALSNKMYLPSLVQSGKHNASSNEECLPSNPGNVVRSVPSILHFCIPPCDEKTSHCPSGDHEGFSCCPANTNVLLLPFLSIIYKPEG